MELELPNHIICLTFSYCLDPNHHDWDLGRWTESFIILRKEAEFDTGIWGRDN